MGRSLFVGLPISNFTPKRYFCHMANNYFQFKQFTVQQENCAMKVCTDSCLFGAWTASLGKYDNILDIGAGTGLLTLMLAQKNTKSRLTAIELDADAAAQTKENLAESPWHSHATVIQGALQEWNTTSKYHLIISNPPFFANDLKSNNTQRNTALHSTDLTIIELLDFASKHITENGKIALLLPFYRAGEIEKIIANNPLYIERKTTVRQTPGHEPFRVMYFIGHNIVNYVEDEIIVKNTTNQYSQAFAELMQDYYLFL